MVSGDSSADSETEFVYDPLDSKPRTFRLIKLLPSTKPFFPFWREALRVEIVEQSLEEAAIFDTLSYTWGNVGRSLPDRPVIVETPRGRRILKIYASLELALLGLEKSGTADRPLFVDQICINQENNDEKASQVKLMGDIYAGCGRVIVWLGPGTRRSDEYFRFVSDICCEGVLSRVMGPNASHFPKVFKAVMDPSIEVSGVEREDRDDLLRLMRRYGHRFPLHGNSDVLGRMWFNRLWTIQEICLASNAVFTCGSHTLCFDCFRAGLLYYTIWNKVRNAKPGFFYNREFSPANLYRSMCYPCFESRYSSTATATYTFGLAKIYRRDINNLCLVIGLVTWVRSYPKKRCI